MRCHICDRPLDEPRFNSDHQDYEPCDSCLFVINETLEGFKDNASAAEDDLPDEDISRVVGWYTEDWESVDDFT